MTASARLSSSSSVPGLLDQHVCGAAQHQVQTGVLASPEVRSHRDDRLDSRVRVAALPGRPGVRVRSVEHRDDGVAAIDRISAQLERAVEVWRIAEQGTLRVVLRQEDRVARRRQQLR